MYSYFRALFINVSGHLVIVVYLDGDQGRGPLDVLPPAVHHQPREHKQLVPGGGQRLVNYLGQWRLRPSLTCRQADRDYYFIL